MNIRLLILFIFILFLNACEKESAIVINGDVYVTVFYKEGNTTRVLKGASVFTVPKTKQDTTDAYGTVLFKDIEPGTYELYANLEGFGSGKAIIKVKADSINKVDIQLIKGQKIGFTPEISMILPELPANFSTNEKIVFSFDIKDNDTPTDKIDVVLTSSLDGKLLEAHPDAFNNVKFESTSLSRGVHKITITATDKDLFSTNYTFEVSTLAPGIVYMDTAIYNSGEVKINWKKYTNADFYRYELYRTENIDVAGVLLNSIDNADSLNFNDRSAPFVSEVYYYVKVVNKDNFERLSNKVKVKNPGGKIYYYAASDAIHHPSKPIIYIIDNIANKLRSINYESTEEKVSSSLQGTAGKIDIADNGFGLEIYIPSSDGNIYVYNAASLSLVYTINTGLPTKSVVSNGHGYVVASVSPSPWWEMPVRSYSRSSGINISANSGTGGVFESEMLRFIPNTDQIISISTSVSPVDMNYFEFDNTGNCIIQKDDSYHGDHILDPNIFKISPNGEYLVTGKEGVVYGANQNMLYKGEVKRGALNFSDFAFGNDGNTIYGATSNRTSIQIINYPDLSRESELLIRGYPKFIFNYNGKIISLSSLSMTEEGNFAIEIVSP